MKLNIDKLDKFSGIIESVCYWLGYQSKIGREQLIHEASLRYPIADSITSRNTAVKQVELEKLHPLFKSKKIDLVIYKDEDRETLTEIFEFKLTKHDSAREGSDEYQRVFDDVVRLAYFNKWENKDCYFLMCGKYSDFKTYFVQQDEIPIKKGDKKITIRQSNNKNEKDETIKKWEPKSIYKNWFGFQIEEEKNITFSSTNKELQSFQKRYIIRNDDLHSFGNNDITIKTTCMAITPYGTDKSRTHAAGIWKIESE